ncbi:KTSC domain-containing protein [Undibacterium sp.]|uniref:KTSC domain-containing protein n=1 Tax=Undibacterium sp. TaxID=1914977 RepID=UPI0037505514
MIEMKRINAGKLRAIGYDARERLLRVELDDGSAIDYAGVGQEVWRRLSTASSSTAWSFYRDNIEEEFHGKRGVARVAAASSGNRSALEDLFKSPSVDETPK